MTFVSKLLERCAYEQMVDYLQLHQLLPEEQSAYRRFHSTETAMLKVLSDAYVAADSGQVPFLVCLILAQHLTLLTIKYLFNASDIRVVSLVLRCSG